MTDGNIMAIIMAVHMTRNIPACASGDCDAIRIHAIDIDHPPGIGIAVDICCAIRRV